MYQEALLEEMMRPRMPREQGGVMGPRASAPGLFTGGNAPGGSAEQIGAPPLQAPAGTTATGPTAPPGLGSFAGKLEGFDQGKLAGDHDSPKYQFGRVMSQFDPKGGITDDLLAALNALGLGTVSGKTGGDKISIGGNVDPRFEGVTEFDIIRDLEGGGGWQWGGLNGKAAQSQGQGRPMQGGGFAPPGIGALMQDPSSGIAAALANSRTPNIEALLAQLAGGQ